MKCLGCRWEDGTTAQREVTGNVVRGKSEREVRQSPAFTTEYRAGAGLLKLLLCHLPLAVNRPTAARAQPRVKVPPYLPVRNTGGSRHILCCPNSRSIFLRALPAKYRPSGGRRPRSSAAARREEAPSAEKRQSGCVYCCERDSGLAPGEEEERAVRDDRLQRAPTPTAAAGCDGRR